MTKTTISPASGPLSEPRVHVQIPVIKAKEILDWFILNRWATWLLNNAAITDTHYVFTVDEKDKMLVLKLVDALNDGNKHVEEAGHR